MNQIPNIEEVDRIVKSLPKDLHCKNAINELYVRQALISQAEKHHHQLQKARQDWLREEIVKLEGELIDEQLINKEGWHRRNSQWIMGTNEAFQTIIDRYHSELDHAPEKLFLTEQDYTTLDNMEKHGGSFVQSLAACARHADPLNLAKLKATFKNYWTNYEQF